MYTAGTSAQDPIRPGFRGRILLVELVRPARPGPFVTVIAPVDADAGLYRVAADGKEGRTYTVSLDPRLSDPAFLARLVEHINAADVARVLTDIGDHLPAAHASQKFLSTKRSS